MRRTWTSFAASGVLAVLFGSVFSQSALAQAPAATPGSILVIPGTFDPALLTTVVFADLSGAETRVDPSSVSPTAVEVTVPVLLDPELQSRADIVFVSVVQQVDGAEQPAGSFGYLEIADLPKTGLPPGSVVIEVLNQLDKVIGRTSQDWKVIGSNSSGLINPDELRYQLGAMQAQLSRVRFDILSLQAGEVDSISLTEAQERPVVLDRSSLALMDRFLVAAILGKRQAQEVPRLGVMRASTVDPALSGDDLLGSVRDHFQQFLTTFGTSTLDFAKKYKAGLSLTIGLTTTVLTLNPAAGAVMGAIAFSVATFVPAAIAASVQGGGAEILRGEANPEDFRQTVDYLRDSYLGLAIGKSLDFMGSLSGPVAQKLFEASKYARNVRTLMDSGNPQSVTTQTLDSLPMLAGSFPKASIFFFDSRADGGSRRDFPNPEKYFSSIAVTALGSPGTIVEAKTSWGPRFSFALEPIEGCDAPEFCSEYQATYETSMVSSCAPGEISFFAKGNLLKTVTVPCIGPEILNDRPVPGMTMFFRVGAELNQGLRERNKQVEVVRWSSVSLLVSGAPQGETIEGRPTWAPSFLVPLDDEGGSAFGFSTEPVLVKDCRPGTVSFFFHVEPMGPFVPVDQDKFLGSVSVACVGNIKM